MTEYYKKWYKKNRSRILQEMKKKYKNNLIYRKKVLKRNIQYKVKNPEYFYNYGKLYRKNNKQKLNKYFINKYKTDIHHYLAVCLRNRMYQALKNKFKTGSAVRELGCSIEFFKIYLETQFKLGMTWQNRGKVWHIDHIIPLYHFDLTKKEEFDSAAHYTNLQPMFAKENLSKNKQIFNIKEKKSKA